MGSRDVMHIEEWTRVNSLPTVYKNRRDGFIRRRFEYYLGWHVYVLFLTAVCFVVGFVGVSGPAPNGRSVAVWS
jgi:hypothetical protein